MDHPEAAPKKPGRGGARPGAGRKPKALTPTAVIGTDLAAALAAPVPEDVDSLAAEHAPAVLAALEQQLLYGAKDSPKIDAALAILDRGYGRPTVEAGADAMLPFLGRAPVRQVANEIREGARRLARLAIAVLDKIQRNGTSEAVRVRAGRALWDRGLGTVMAAHMPASLGPAARPAGKREQTQSGAKAAAVGRYAPPPAPRVIQ